MSDFEIYDPASHSSQSVPLVKEHLKMLSMQPHIIRNDLECVDAGNDINAEIDAQGPFIVAAPNAKECYFSLAIGAANSSKNKSLLGEFIGIDDTIESYCAFANKHSDIYHSGPTVTRQGIETAFSQQSYLFWARSQWLLKYTFELSEWIRYKDTTKINATINRESDNSFSYILGDPAKASMHRNNCKLRESAILQYMTFSGETLSLYENPGYFLLEGEREYTTKISNDKTELAKILLTGILQDNMKDYPTLPSPTYNPTRKAIEHGFNPSSLLALFWYQLFQKVTGEIKLKRCAICNQWQDVTHARTNWKSHRDCQARMEKRRQRALQREGESK